MALLVQLEEGARMLNGWAVSLQNNPNLLQHFGEVSMLVSADGTTAKDEQH
jgi:hypothetical protein